MRQWSKHSAGEVVRNEMLLHEMKKDYLRVMGITFETNCNSCFYKQYNNFIKKLTMKQTRKTEYLLKAKYNGLSFKGKIYSNVDLTDKTAKELLKNHPAGAKLFDAVPEVKPTAKKTKKVEE